MILKMTFSTQLRVTYSNPNVFPERKIARIHLILLHWKHIKLKLKLKTKVWGIIYPETYQQ